MGANIINISPPGDTPGFVVEFAVFFTTASKHLVRQAKDLLCKKKEAMMVSHKCIQFRGSLVIDVGICYYIAGHLLQIDDESVADAYQTTHHA